MEQETTTQERAASGQATFERIRALQRESYIKGVAPAYIIVTVNDIQNLVDYFIYTEKLSPFDANGIPRILGMELISDERKILRL